MAAERWIVSSSVHRLVVILRADFAGVLEHLADRVDGDIHDAADSPHQRAFHQHVEDQ